MSRPRLWAIRALIAFSAFGTLTAGGEPVADPATSAQVSLSQMLTYANRHAPAIRVGRSRLSLGRAELKVASSLLPADPEIALAAGPRFSPTGRSIDVEISVQQRFQIAGERGLRIEVAKRFGDRVRAELAQVKWAVHRRVHAAYGVVLVAQKRLAAAERMLTFAERLLSIAQRRESAGAISGLQVQVVKGEVAQAKQAKIAKENAYGAARLKLAEISGWPADRPPDPQGPLEPPRAPPAIGRLITLARSHHPALYTQAAHLREAQAKATLADREAVPQPTLGVVYSRESDGGAAATNIVLGTLSVAIPIWQRNQGARKRAQAQVTVARTQYRALNTLLHSQVARAAASVAAGAKRVAVYGAKVIPSFEQNLKMLQRAFEAGKIDVLQVMVARSRFLEIQRQALDAYEDYYRAAAELESVVGTEVWSTTAKRSVQR